MNLDLDFYPHIEQIPWFSTIGFESRLQVDFPVSYLSSPSEAVSGFNSDLWVDVKTEAQGDLTGYLSKHHYSAYGGYWNNLARQSRVLVEKTVGTQIAATLAAKSFPVDMLQPILTDINRAALEVAYRRKFPKAPLFFERLLKIYEAGRLPCGWNGSLANWPHGDVIVF